MPRTTPTPITDPTAPAGPTGGPGLVARLASATPAHRDRTVDALRAFAIVVVVLWHWTFSVTHWDGEGRLVMPNPVGDVPMAWLATWVLQVMPLFFVVGGFANLAGWDAARREGRGDLAFLRDRTARLVRPSAVLLGAWGLVELARALVAPHLPPVWHWGVVVFVPLWFLGTYLAVVALTPLTARLHHRFGVRAVVGTAGLVVACDVLRLGLDVGGPEVGGVGVVALAGSATVWVLAHQLGHLWRSGGIGRRAAWTMVAGALAVLVVATGVGPYPRSMVAVRGEASNLFPTSAAVAVLAVLQLGIVVLARPRLARWLERPAAWRATIAVNAVAMTVFCWHMTALVVAIGAWHLVGGELADQPTAAWWWSRPVWVVLPALALAPLVAAFHRWERPRRT